MTKFYQCNCYLSHNIFIKTYKTHFIYKNDAQFFKDYNKLLNNISCNTVDKKQSLLKEIYEEIERRKNQDIDTANRKALISKSYQPIVADIFILEDEMFEPNFLHLVEVSKDATIENMLPHLNVISKGKQLYGIQIFRKWYCEKLIAEIEHFEESDLPKGRPNTMNKYGVLLDELGIQTTFSDVLRKKLECIAKVLFPRLCGSGLDSHMIFSISYKVGQDVDLDLHYDNSEVTLNLCLGKTFSNGQLYVGDVESVPVKNATFLPISHQVGYGILHNSQQLHGALPVTQGERVNLILWMRSSSVRNKLCPMCHSFPCLVPAADYGDGFTKNEQE